MATQQPAWVVEFYTDARGKSAVVEFINGLPAQERAKVRNALHLLREFGVLLRLPYARSLSGHHPLWELRAGGDPAALLCPHGTPICHSARLPQKVSEDTEAGERHGRAPAG